MSPINTPSVSYYKTKNVVYTQSLKYYVERTYLLSVHNLLSMLIYKPLEKSNSRSLTIKADLELAIILICINYIYITIIFSVLFTNLNINLAKSF